MIILHFISSPIGGTINFEIIFYIVTAQKSKYAAHSINIYWVLTDVAELVGHHSAWRNAAGLIPSQGTCTWVASSVLIRELAKDNRLMFLSHTDISVPLCFSSPLSKNK